MGFSGAMLAMSAVQATSQISQGYAQKAEAKFNASLLDQKAGLIDTQASIEYGQYQRLKAQNQATAVASTAKSGIAPQGSSLAYMIEAQRQISIDQAIGQFNFTQEKNYTKAQASAQRRAGKQAVYTGYSNALSTMMQAGSNYAMYNKRDTTFDSAKVIKNTGYYEGRM